jgi:hypothetical protein
VVVRQTEKRGRTAGAERSGCFRKYEKRRLSDDGVMAAQREFEKQLDESIDLDLPDAIRWSTAFTYWHLMRKWFSALMASNRCDEKSSDKMKSDWLNYMDFLEERETSLFLAEWGKDDKKRAAYREEATVLKRKIELIENAFAIAIGPEAVEQLEHVRSSPLGAFDRSGKKPMAPIGYRYSVTSLRPYVEELVVGKPSHSLF